MWGRWWGSDLQRQSAKPELKAWHVHTHLSSDVLKKHVVEKNRWLFLLSFFSKIDNFLIIVVIVRSVGYLVYEAIFGESRCRICDDDNCTMRKLTDVLYINEIEKRCNMGPMQ